MKQVKSANELAQLVRTELGGDVDLDDIWVSYDHQHGWRVTCIGKPLTVGGFQYIADRIVERLREHYDLEAL
ncbi:hypothetical protein [Rhodoplanes sp. Z2-YC6860]|uniref:hypothetical protein n=1 Tax=Rhodoplanes sp. Z2-YC6860 TaxID=674703 RepID=UPI00082ECF5F|nr:hypothetical protein [Rhodoplanes sp. Z2-YC6860]